MRTKLACLITPLALLLAACGGDDGSADTTNADTTATDPTGTTAPTTDPTTETSVDPTDATTTVDPTDATTTVDPTDATGSTGPDPDTGSESGGTPEICVIEPDDDECTQCTKNSCCTELDACYADADCACVVLCVQTQLAMNPDLKQGTALGICTTQMPDMPPPMCMLPGDPTLVFNLATCTAAPAPDGCGDVC